jgi:hypothetical protein
MFAAKNELLTRPSGGAYQISRSLRFNSADSAYLNRTPATTTNRQTWTWSGWVKRSNLAATITLFATNYDTSIGDGDSTIFRFSSTDNLAFIDANTLTTAAVFRDVSAWYHIVLSVDTTQATAANRVKLYVNNVQQTVTGTYPSQNDNTFVNSTNIHGIGGSPINNGVPFSFRFQGYMADVYLIDGQALTPSSFGETDTQTGVWKPKAYSGSYGTNGFYVNFSDNSNTTAATLGKDYSGNGNNWTPNNFSVSAGADNDSLVDSPTSYGGDTGVGGNVRGNYCTLNPLFFNGVTTIVPTNGNLDFTFASAANRSAYGTIGMSSGKWYCEVIYTTLGGSPNPGLSLVTGADTSTFVGFGPAQYCYDASGVKISNNVNSAYGASWTTNDVVGIAFDADAGTLTFYKNGVSQGTAFTGLTAGSYVFGVTAYGGGTGNINFGQRPFDYTAPSGFKALCTQNLPTPTIGATTATQAGKFFNPVLYTGNSSTLAVTGVGFQPDLVWVKGRSTAFNHRLVDAVRGVTKSLFSNLTDAETTESGVTAFNSDGFTLGSSAGLNFASDTYVAWNWKANGSGSSNTAGTITSTVSVNTTSGFSIVTWAGPNNNTTSTVGHGLGVVPSVVFYKARTAVTNWTVYFGPLSSSASNVLYLNSTSGLNNDSNVFNNTAPTSTVLTVKNVEVNGASMVAYCFAPIAGYSAFGFYIGNGNADGPFVFTGFKPAFVIIKVTSASNVWLMLDATRNPYNFVDLNLNANSSAAENTFTGGWADFNSNGFKIRTGSDGAINTNAGTYIYMAFASNPFKYSLAR